LLKLLRVSETFQDEFKYIEHYLTDELEKQGVKTDFLTSTGTPQELKQFLTTINFKPGMYEYKHSKIVRLKSVNFFGKKIIIDIRKLFNLITKSGYEVIHIQGIGNYITFSVLFCTFFMKNHPVIVINDHSDPNNKRSGFKATIFYSVNRILFYLLNSKINKIITVNQASKIFLTSYYGLTNSKIDIIPLGYNARVFKYLLEKKNKESDLIIGFAGKINEAKNLELLIDIVTKINNVKCRIVGMNEDILSVYQKQLLEYQSDKITFHPLIKDPKKLAEFYNEIDVAIFPGSISITTIEATGCGTPIILYKSMSGLEDRVENGRGSLFNTKEELQQIIEEYKIMKQESAINNQQIEKNTMTYSWKTIAEIYLEEYKNLLENR